MKQFIVCVELVFVVLFVGKVRSDNNLHDEISAELRSKDYQRNLSASRNLEFRTSTAPGISWNSGKINRINAGNDQTENRLDSFNGSQNWEISNSKRSGRVKSYNENTFSKRHRFSGLGPGGFVTKSKTDIMQDVDYIGDWIGNSSTPQPISTLKPTKNMITMRRSYRKNHDIRHICMQHKTVYTPVKTTEIYTRPLWRYINEPCKSQQPCSRVQLIHEQTFRDVVRHKTSKQITYDCCPGWEQISKTADDCMKPVCVTSCQNGGSCTKPGVCSCQPGFSGRYCERDINECEDDKPCDQLCFNTAGSYYCKCREGFFLHSDNQGCKRIEGDVDDAFEARDLENEIDSNSVEQLGSRLHKIEKLLANEKIADHDFKKSLQATAYVVNSLKTRLSTLENRQQDISSFQRKLIAQDEKTRKLEHLISVLFKCKTNPLPYCP